jgi:hypothetical protein
MKSKPKDRFIQGIVVALDVVALYDQPVLFKEIVELAGTQAVLTEIAANGLERTKKLAAEEFGSILG